MPRSGVVDRIGKFVDPFRITKDKRFRLKDIAHFEDYLARQGTIVLKSRAVLAREKR